MAPQAPRSVVKWRRRRHVPSNVAPQAPRSVVQWRRRRHFVQESTRRREGGLNRTNSTGLCKIHTRQGMDRDGYGHGARKSTSLAREIEAPQNALGVAAGSSSRCGGACRAAAARGRSCRPRRTAAVAHVEQQLSPTSNSSCRPRRTAAVGGAGPAAGQGGRPRAGGWQGGPVLSLFPEREQTTPRSLAFAPRCEPPRARAPGAQRIRGYGSSLAFQRVSRGPDTTSRSRLLWHQNELGCNKKPAVVSLNSTRSGQAELCSLELGELSASFHTSPLF
eukprot:gene12804-biopygen1944